MKTTTIFCLCSSINVYIDIYAIDYVYSDIDNIIVQCILALYTPQFEEAIVIRSGVYTYTSALIPKKYMNYDELKKLNFIYCFLKNQEENQDAYRVNGRPSEGRQGNFKESHNPLRPSGEITEFQTTVPDLDLDLDCE